MTHTLVGKLRAAWPKSRYFWTPDLGGSDAEVDLLPTPNGAGGQQTFIYTGDPSQAGEADSGTAVITGND